MSDKYNGNYPKAWSESEIATYKESGQEPRKTSNGLWVSDPEREAKELKDWSLAELYALAMGELFSFKSTGTDEFYQAVRGKALLDDRDAVKWGEEDLDNWLLFEKAPAKSPNGYYINDPDRWVKDASLWNDTELADLGAGYFGMPEQSQMYILDEASDRFELPLGITWDDFVAYITTKAKPAMTSNGILVNDRRRTGKSVSDYSDDEVEAWVRDEIVLPEEQQNALLERGIALFGGGRYWNLPQLHGFVVDNEIPEIDYEQYTDEQLEILAKEDGDKVAEAELQSRHPEPEEPEDEPAPVPPVTEQPDDEAAEAAPEADDSDGEPAEETGEAGPDESWEGSGDLGEAEEEPPVEESPQVLWTDLVPEGSAVYEALVARTPDVVIADDERRRMLSASKWSLEELIAWGRGEIQPGLNSTDETCMTALRVALGGFVRSWSDRAIKAFVRTQELPEGIGGVLREDVLRDRMHPGDWTDDDLKAWAEGFVITPVDPGRILLAARARYKIPDRLNDEEVKEFIVTGRLPDDTVPPIIAGKHASVRQMEAWLKGEIDAPEEEHARLFTKARQHYGIDVHWTDAHILAYIRNGSFPAKTADGVMIEDRLRDPDSPNGWAWPQLKALAKSEIVANFSVNDALPRVRRLVDVQFGRQDKQWSDQEVIDFLVSNAVPKALEDGVYINDPTRLLKQPIEWRDAEVKAWLRGDIQATEFATEDLLWDEVYSRFRVPLFWYREDAKSYVLNGVSVPSTRSGIWVRDRNRDARPAEHWTRREIKAWCRGQIMPPLSATPEQMVVRAANLFGVTTMLDADSIKKRISAITEESMTMTVKFVTEDLAAYAAGRKEAGDNGAKAHPYQSLLDRCISRVLRLEGEDFVQGWTELLNFFYEHSKDIMSPKKIYTGVGQMAITPKGLRNFNALTAVLLQTADPAGRDAQVKVIEWNAALKDISNETTRQQILAYYGAH